MSFIPQALQLGAVILRFSASRLLWLADAPIRGELDLTPLDQVPKLFGSGLQTIGRFLRSSLEQIIDRARFGTVSNVVTQQISQLGRRCLHGEFSFEFGRTARCAASPIVV
ncbi:hypothetical protein A5739_00515 [Mycobacterium colombiense]|nr:hypothetical protein A5732_20120 [Mycobacterium colombiense]OMC35333.1 hypothetical protein A5739_00515 [Mycobacterium colombiense]